MIPAAAAWFEIIEHTADVGVRAGAPTLAGLLEQAAMGLCDIAGIWFPGRGERVEVALEAGDPGGLLVAWLSEILFLHETRDALVAAVSVAPASATALTASVELAARGDRVVEGTAVKAVTYHGLRVEPDGHGWRAQFYVDV